MSAEEPKKLKSQTIKITTKWVSRAENATIVNLEMLQLPPGKITLKDKDGKEKEHEIKAIWLGKYEVRWDDYDGFWQRLDLSMEDIRKGVDAKSRPSKPYAPPDGGYGRDNYPAGRVHFVAAQQYCVWLSQQTGKKFRLPTEAEWEYACRAGGPPVKLAEKELDKAAWFDKNSNDEPHAVGKKAPNAWGFHDMLGNIAEFVIVDPFDKTKGLLAGGSYQDDIDHVNSDAREPWSREWHRKDPSDPPGVGWLEFVPRAGMRVVMEDPPDDKQDKPGDKPQSPLAPKSK